MQRESARFARLVDNARVRTVSFAINRIAIRGVNNARMVQGDTEEGREIQIPPRLSLSRKMASSGAEHIQYTHG